jgi:NADPH:quinone reductase-like Zn-dependent oxidoreductase/acyl carrier protein
MRMEDAAGIPIAFLTAMYGLTRLANLQRGERVLIHAAAGGVGLAAVQLAQRAGAEVFATAGSDAKRDYLRALGVRHVFDSRSLAFADEVRAATNGEGVHVVLNSLAGDFIPATLGVVRNGGRFLELGKRDILTADDVARTRPDVSYHAFDLGSEAHADRTLLGPMFADLLAGLSDGTLRPLPVKVFAFANVIDGFRFMAQARHIGKIVVRVAKARGARSTKVGAEGTYWVTGGLGGLGLGTARWLADSGATHIALSGRSAPSAAARGAIEALEHRGASVRVFAADAGDRAQMDAVIAEIDATMPPLRGVVHAAGVVRDAVLMNQRWAEGAEVMRGKAHGAWVLHELTRDRELDFFVMYSAAGAVLGASGQGVYPAANAQLDALAQGRHALGLPALSVAWGPWAHIGMTAGADGSDVWESRGLIPISPARAFSALDRLLRDGAAYAALMPIDWRRFLSQLTDGADREFFQAVTPQSAAQRSSSAPAAESVVDRIRARAPGERRDALIAHLAERALHVLGLDAGTRVDPARPLKDIGLDSLMSVELRNALSRSVGHPLPATLLFDYPTLDALSAYLLRTLSLEDGNGTATEEPVTRDDSEIRAVAELSDDEAEAALLAELENPTTEPRR